MALARKGPGQRLSGADTPRVVPVGTDNRLRTGSPAAGRLRPYSWGVEVRLPEWAQAYSAEPPVVSMVWPVTQRASGEATKATTSATPCG
ncbi:hypothetical protein FrEUN1fDRAFT_0811 [Parafrankia sp. EUN1f]|nr:hypothetical protein FrEUN1fDRAFT_0811 [Parafrankia sp. EUN1f]